MADKDHQELVIHKRRGSSADGHHGGAWKIAFADFMTAMMALFLVLWLISSTSEKTKHAVAQYFNPVKLVDVTTLKKGFRDPKRTEMGAGPKTSESSEEADTRQALAETRDIVSQPGAKLPTHSEAALFRDPYAVLAEIAGDTPLDQSPKPVSGPAETAPIDADSDTLETFKDPFATVPQIAELVGRSDLPDRRKEEAAASAAQKEPPLARPHAEPPQPSAAARAPSQAAAVASATESAPRSELDAARVKAELAVLTKQDARTANGPMIDVQDMSEGILISLTDDRNFSMFAIGSAEPQSKTVAVMAKIGELLRARPGAVVIRGHTDGRPFKSAAYDNWRLSTARAHMAHYMLSRGGLDEKRIEKIEGYADRRPKIAADPMAASNRRIEILLRKERP